MYQYSAGMAIATNIAYRILNKEDGIVEKYINFLKLGNSISIKDALKYLNIEFDLNKCDYINVGFNLLNDKIEQLKRMFK